MAGANQANSATEQLNKAIATAVQVASETVEAAIAQTTTAMGQFVGQGTETVGQIITPIAEHPVVKFATKVPGLSWLMAALGQVNLEKVKREVEQLRDSYPLETSEQLAHRVMVQTAWQAGSIGLVTNFIPPLALTLLAIDLAAVTALQAEMIYRIAAIYGFSLSEPARRGEVLAIWGISTGSSGVLKTGLSFVEIIPGIGTIAGATTNAALLYVLGYVACRFYQEKLNTI